MTAAGFWAAGVYMPRGRPGRPGLLPLEGQVGFGDLGCDPDDEALIVVIVEGLDVADGVALAAKEGVVGVVVEVGDDGSVVEVCHCGDPFLHQPDC